MPDSGNTGNLTSDESTGDENDEEEKACDSPNPKTVKDTLVVTDLRGKIKSDKKIQNVLYQLIRGNKSEG